MMQEIQDDDGQVETWMKVNEDIVELYNYKSYFQLKLVVIKLVFRLL